MRHLLTLLTLFVTAGLAFADAAKARTHVKTGDWLAALEELAEINPGDLDAHLTKLDVLLTLGRYEDAAKHLAIALGELPKDGELTLRAARLAAATGKLAEARQLATKATELEPNLAPAWLLRHELAAMVGDRDAVKLVADAITELTRTNPPTAAILNAQAGVAAADDPHGAWAKWQRANKLHAGYAPAFIDGGFHCYNKYAWGYAAECFEGALSAQPNHPDANAGMAAIAVAKSGYDRAMPNLDAALAVNPNHPLARLLKATILIAERRPADSLAEIEAVLAVNPKHVDALGMLAAHYDGLGDVAARGQAVARALAINPNDPSVFVALSEAAERRYRFDQALAWGRRAIAVAPRDWQGEFHAGTALLRLGEEKEGYELLDRAFTKNGFNIWAYNMLLVLDKDFKKKEFVYRETEHFFVKMDREDEKVLWPYLAPALEDIWQRQTEKYGFTPSGPKETGGKILILFLPSHTYFSARTVGLPGMHAAGACFGQVITMPSPRNAEGPNSLNWVKVLDHEFAHVMALQMSNYRVPRWFTEGLSTVEEQDSNVRYDDLLKWAVQNNKLLPIEDMNVAFSRPRFNMQIPLSYYHGALVCDYLIDTYGFEAILKILKGYRDQLETPELFPQVTGKSMSTLNEEALAFVKARADQIHHRVPTKPDRLEDLEARNESGELTPKEWLELAWGYVDQGDNEQAVMAAEMAAVKGLTKRANLLLAYLSWRDAPKAIKTRAMLSQAKTQLPTDPLPPFLLGLIAKEAGDHDRAIAHFEEARKLSPRTVSGPTSPYPHLAELYELNANPGKAIATYRAWTAIDYVNQKALRKLGELLLASGKPRAAAEAFQRLIEVNPYEATHHHLAAESWDAAKAHDQAERNYRVILALEPRNLPILHKMIRRYIDTNRRDDAQNLIDRISFFAPNDPTTIELKDELEQL